MQTTRSFVGMDVHTAFISISVAEDFCNGCSLVPRTELILQGTSHGIVFQDDLETVWPLRVDETPWSRTMLHQKETFVHPCSQNSHSSQGVRMPLAC